MKKGQTESYSFLIGIIITFLMMTAVGCVIYKTYSGKAETEKTFKLLVDQLNGLKEGEEGESPFFIEEQKVLVGFDQDKDELSIEEDCGDWKLPIQIKKPKAEICKKEACLCLCNLQTDGGEVSEETCAVASCKGIKTASFFRGGKTCSGVFISGKTTKGEVVTLAFKIEEGTLYLGKESVKERIEKIEQRELEKLKQQELDEKAKKVFDTVSSKFENCYKTEITESCLCKDSEIDLRGLPEGYEIKTIRKLENRYSLVLYNPKKELVKEYDIDAKIGLWSKAKQDRETPPGERKQIFCTEGLGLEPFSFNRDMRYYLLYNLDSRFFFYTLREKGLIDSKEDGTTPCTDVQQDKLGKYKGVYLLIGSWDAPNRKLYLDPKTIPVLRYCSGEPVSEEAAKEIKERELEEKEKICKSYTEEECYDHLTECYPYLYGGIYDSCNLCEADFKCEQILFSKSLCELNPCQTTCEWRTTGVLGGDVCLTKTT